MPNSLPTDSEESDDSNDLDTIEFLFRGTSPCDLLDALYDDSFMASLPNDHWLQGIRAAPRALPAPRHRAAPPEPNLENLRRFTAQHSGPGSRRQVADDVTRFFAGAPPRRHSAPGNSDSDEDVTLDLNEAFRHGFHIPEAEGFANPFVQESWRQMPRMRQRQAVQQAAPATPAPAPAPAAPSAPASSAPGPVTVTPCALSAPGAPELVYQIGPSFTYVPSQRASNEANPPAPQGQAEQSRFRYIFQRNAAAQEGQGPSSSSQQTQDEPMQQD